MEALTEYLQANKPKAFKAVPIYYPEGDSLTFIFDDARYYRERIDDFLTVYRAIFADSTGQKDRLVGCQIKGLPEAITLLGSFGLTITDEPIKLTMLFLASMARSESEQKHFYVDLAKRDESKNAEISAADLKAA